MTQETIPVVAAAVKKHGPQAAMVLCLIRYRCQVTGSDRVEAADGRMWRASHQTISEGTGLSHDAVRRATKKLEAAGALSTEWRPAHYGDQTRTYRVLPDADVWAEDRDAQSTDYAETHTPNIALTTDYAKSPDGRRRNRRMVGGEIADSSISQEGEKKGEEVRVAAAPAPAPSRSASKNRPVQSPLLAVVPNPAPTAAVSRYCSKHPKGTPDNCGACGAARRAFEAAEAADAAAGERGAQLELAAKKIRDINANLDRESHEDGVEYPHLTPAECGIVREWLETKSVPMLEFTTRFYEARRKGVVLAA